MNEDALTSESDPADIYMQAQALFLGRHYRRDFNLINASQIVLRDLRFRYLAAKCLEDLKEWDQCLSMLGESKVDEHGNVSDTKDSHFMYLDKDGKDREINDNYNAAIAYYHKALWLTPDDQFCTEMLTSALVDESRQGIHLKIDTCRNELFI